MINKNLLNKIKNIKDGYFWEREDVFTLSHTDKWKNTVNSALLDLLNGAVIGATSTTLSEELEPEAVAYLMSAGFEIQYQKETNLTTISWD